MIYMIDPKQIYQEESDSSDRRKGTPKSIIQGIFQKKFWVPTFFQKKYRIQ